MTLLQKLAILIKNLRSLSKAIEWIAQQGSETWKLRQSAEDNLQYWYNCPATTLR